MSNAAGKNVKLLLQTFLWLASVGWLVPTYLSIHSYFGYQTRVVQSFVWDGRNSPVDSFPYLGFSESCFHLAFLWVSLVIGGWSLYLIRRVFVNPPYPK